MSLLQTGFSSSSRPRFVPTLFISEALAPVILRHEVEALRKKIGGDRNCTAEKLERKPTAETMRVALLGPTLMMLTEPIVLFVSFCEYATL